MSGYIKWATPLATATEIAHSQWSREVKNAKTLFTWWKRQYPTSTRQDWLFYSGRQDVRFEAAAHVWDNHNMKKRRQQRKEKRGTPYQNSRRKMLN
ncbi:hypothetical protein ACF0H5_005959 [Mactra antiquata]